MLPVLFAKKHLPQNDPFNLNVGFKFSSTGGGSRFDMRTAVDTALAPAAGMAYYHRRGHLGEPPNMLNPFWHATLVPLEIDERSADVGGKAYDPTRDSQLGGKTRMRKLIEATGGYAADTDAIEAYNGLRNHIGGMSKPAVNGP